MTKRPGIWGIQVEEALWEKASWKQFIQKKKKTIQNQKPFHDQKLNEI